MPQRVLFMISSMRGGGSEQQTLLLLRHVDRAQLTPHLYLTERIGDLMSCVPQDVVVHGFDEAPEVSDIYVPGRAIRRQVRHLRDLLVNHSIDVIYDRTFHMSAIAGPAGAAVAVPRISTIVSPPECALPMLEPRFLRLKRVLLARAYRRSAKVLAVSHQAAESAQKYYRLPGGSVEVVPNSVDVANVALASRAETLKRDERLTLVCVGRMTEEKGQGDLVKAVRLLDTDWPSGLPSLHVWMIGDGALRRTLQTDWERTPCRHEIEFLGQQPNPAPYMAAADALVLPSHFEGMPNVVLEAMSLGTPVIATRAGGTIELEREEPTILWAQPSQPESLAKAIVQFARDRTAAKCRADAARLMIDKYHNVADATALIQRRLVEASVSRRASLRRGSRPSRT